MAEELNSIEILKGAIATIAERKDAVLIFVTTLTVFGTFIEWGVENIDVEMLAAFGVFPTTDATVTEWTSLALGWAAMMLVWTAVYALPQYLLLEALMRESDYLPGQRGSVFISFCGLQLLTFLALCLGLILLVIPGYWILARLVVAPPYLIRERTGIMDSMRSSWILVRGNATPVVLLLLAATAVIAIPDLLYDASPDATRGDAVMLGWIIVAQLVSHSIMALEIALGLFMFNRLHRSSAALSAVFE